MPTITLRRKDGSEIKTVKSHLLVCHAGSVTHTLHLHKNDSGEWVVSDPGSGGKILHLEATHLGCPVSTYGFSYAEVKPLAFAQVEALIERVGSDRFNAILGAHVVKA